MASVWIWNCIVAESLYVDESKLHFFQDIYHPFTIIYQLFFGVHPGAPQFWPIAQVWGTSLMTRNAAASLPVEPGVSGSPSPIHFMFSSGKLTLRPSGKLTVCYRKNGSSRVGKFTYSKWWFSIAVVVYQRVFPDIFVCWYQSIRIFGEDLSIVQWDFQTQWRDCTFKKAMIMWDIPSL
jgi:hypothetical protein